MDEAGRVDRVEDDDGAHGVDADGEPVACGRCGRPVERGNLTGNAGRWWGGGKLGWLPGRLRSWDRLRQGEPLVESLVGGVRLPAYRCPHCRVVWFRYPAE